MGVIESPDGAYRAELTRSEESAGCHGVGGYQAETTVVRVFDRAGREVLKAERTRTEVSSESSPENDEITGTTIEAVHFADDGTSIVLTLRSGDEERHALPPEPGSMGAKFQALSVKEQCECARVACEMALEPWESLLPEEGVSFVLPDAFVSGKLEQSFGRDALEATKLHRDRAGEPMANAIERLCLDMDLAVVNEELAFCEPALEWAAYAFMNLVLAASGKQTFVSEDIPFRNPFLLSVNQAVTAVAFFRSRKDGVKADHSPSSLDPNLLEAIVKDWWDRWEAR